MATSMKKAIRYAALAVLLFGAVLVSCQLLSDSEVEPRSLNIYPFKCLHCIIKGDALLLRRSELPQF